ncbi:redoxin domain-containing protein [Kamptonema cortianum]|nr:redoxin domain-containing protein [Geitlerinema splendidum]MDK3156285.1 redoxin domain-containing protein [Kamptonema cortianum]
MRPISFSAITTRLLTLGVTAILASSVLANQQLGPGSIAPDLNVAWVKGKETKKFEAGKVYVVEFWATWCGPCKVTIPHLSEIAKKYKGKAEIIGVSIWEEPGTTKDDINAFIKSMDGKMEYNVVMDVNDSMAKNWMEASGQNGIPTAFIVNQKGQIAWVGHPSADDLDGTLKQVIEGTWDVAAAKKRADDERAQSEVLKVVFGEIQAALQAGDFVAAIAAVDKGVKNHPEQSPILLTIKVDLLFEFDTDEAQKLALKVAEKEMKGDAMQLNEWAWKIVDPEGNLPRPDLKAAVRIAELACEASKFEDPMILDTYALALYKSGKKAEAIKHQEKAVKLLETAANVPDEIKAEIKARLEQFKKGE